jgi:hypothetical protein
MTAATVRAGSKRGSMVRSSAAWAASLNIVHLDPEHPDTHDLDESLFHVPPIGLTNASGVRSRLRRT